MAGAVERANSTPVRLLAEGRFGGLVGEYEVLQPLRAELILDPHGLGLGRLRSVPAWEGLGLSPDRAERLVRHLGVLRAVLDHRDDVLARCHPADDWTPQQPLTAFAGRRVPRLPGREPGTAEYWRKMERLWSAG